MPLIGSSEWSTPVRTDSSAAEQEAWIQGVRWNFLDALGIRLVAGRRLSEMDMTNGHRVAVVNQTMAARMFGMPNPSGKRVTFVRGIAANLSFDVVGVVADSKYSSLRQRPPPTMFIPYTAVPPRDMTMEVRTAADPLAIAPAVREAIRRVDPTLPIAAMKTQQQQIDDSIGKPRAFAWLTAISSAIGLLLASVGLYGIVSHESTRRTTEIGIRVALGARRGDVIRLIMRQTVVVVAVGAAVGAVLATAASRLIADLLFGVKPFDPLTIAISIVVLIAVAIAASFVPARRASRLDPTQALRCE
jgi:predicted permease